MESDALPLRAAVMEGETTQLSKKTDAAASHLGMVVHVGAARAQPYAAMQSYGKCDLVFEGPEPSIDKVQTPAQGSRRAFEPPSQPPALCQVWNQEVAHHRHFST